MSSDAAAKLTDKVPAAPETPAAKPDVTVPSSPAPSEKGSAGTRTVPAETRFRLRLGPILIVMLLGYGLPILSPSVLDLLADQIRLPLAHGAELPYLYVEQAVLFFLALLAIAIAKRSAPGDYGLHGPHGRSYVLTALAWGAAFGVLMALVDNAPALLANVAPKFDDRLTTANVVGWLLYKGVYAGPTEEVLYRSLLVGYLTVAMPGKVRLGQYELNGAGIVVAVILAFGNVTSFIALPLAVALLQFIYTVAFGTLLAYWFEKSKSILAPIIAHNASGLVSYALMFAMIALRS